MKISAIILAALSLSTMASPDSSADQERQTLGQDKLKERQTLGQDKLREFQEKSTTNTCWRDSVARLNSTCRDLTDTQQSHLAIAFANCHLAKSGRQVYHCDDSMTIQECTGGMDDVAFQTYTEFFTHTGHICFFLQNQLWQEKTDNTIARLSETSSEAVTKLEKALEYHDAMEKKQDQTLDNQAAIIDQDRRIADSLDDTRRSMDANFIEMNEMAQKQKQLLAELFGSLSESIENVRYLMSLFLVEFIGYETIAVFLVASVVVLFLPTFGYSRFKLYLLLFSDLVMEVLVKKVFGYVVIYGEAVSRPPPESMESLHSILWWCRYATFILGAVVYLWEWLTYRDHTLILSDIQQNTDLIVQKLGLESPSKKRASADGRLQGRPPIEPETRGAGRHSWPAQSQQEVPSQPAELSPGEQEAVDGGMMSRARRLFSRRPRTGTGAGARAEQQTPYHFSPIPGLDPPIGHAHSPFTNNRISQYIASLPAHFERDPADQSFASTVANPPDSDQSNTTLLVSDNETSFHRAPLSRSPVTPLTSNVSQSLKNRSFDVESQEPLNNSHNKHHHSEKEVTVEKGLKGTPGSRGLQARRSELPPPPTTPKTPSNPRRRTFMSSTPGTPGRYNLRTRTPKQH